MPNITMRMELPGEEPLASEIVRSAFNDEITAVLVEQLRPSSAWRDLSFFAEADGVPVAHVCFTRGWVDAPDRLVEVLVLSPMSVRSEWQRQGIGTRLIKESLRELRGRPEPVVFLEGNPRFYSRCGFLPATEHGFTRPSVRIPEAAFQCVMLPSYEPSITGALVYPDVFWQYDAVGLRR